VSAPRTNPIFYALIRPEGKPESERIDVTDVILSLEFEDSEKKADLLKVTVDNWDLGFFDNPIWTPGNMLIVSWGYPGVMSPARECSIQKVKGSTTLQVEAQAKSVLMNKNVKTRTFPNTRRWEVVRIIAGEYGYTDDTCHIEETKTTYEHICQSRETDAQFLKRMADQEHFEFYVDFDGLHWHARRMGQKPIRALQYFLPPDVGDILAFDVENDIFAKPGKVTTKARDPITKKDITSEGSDSKTEREALNPVTEIVDPETGISTFRVQASSEEVKHSTSTDPAQVKKEADGAFKRSIQTTVKLTLDLVGDPGIVGKSVIEVRGISKRLSGLYYINEAVHTLDSSGYKLKLKCTTDGTNKYPEAGKPAVSKAKVNEQRGETVDTGELTETVSDETGLSTYKYTDTAGRDKEKK